MKLKCKDGKIAVFLDEQDKVQLIDCKDFMALNVNGDELRIHFDNCGQLAGPAREWLREVPRG